MADENLYLIEKVLAFRKNKETGVEEVKIKWVGYPMSESTWEPVDNLEWEVCEHAFLLHSHLHSFMFPILMFDVKFVVVKKTTICCLWP